MLRTRLILLTSTLLLMPVSAMATGLFDCEVTERANWLSEAELTEKLEAYGWTVRRMKEDGGCWEVYGNTPKGERVEGYFHPITGDAKLIAQRGRILFRAD